MASATPWYTGEKKTFDIRVLDINGEPVNLTGFALSFMVKRHLYDPDLQAAIVKKTSGAGVVLTDPLQGWCAATVLAADTRALPAADYVLELKRTDANNESVLLQQTYTLQQSVHRLA